MIQIKKVNCSKRIFHWQIKINNHSFEQIPLFKTKKDAKKWLINNSCCVKTMSEFSYNKKFDENLLLYKPLLKQAEWGKTLMEETTFYKIAWENWNYNRQHMK